MKKERLIGRERWSANSHVLLVGLKDEGFSASYKTYIDTAEAASDDTYIFGFGTECREMEFDENGFITSVRGGLGGQSVDDQPVEYHEVYDEEIGEFIDEEVERFGGIDEEYALHDAISYLMATAVRRCSDVKDNMTITVVTDRCVDFGSKKHDKTSITNLMDQMRRIGWKVNLLTLEVDAKEAAHQLGIDTERAFNYSCSGEAISIATELV